MRTLSRLLTALAMTIMFAISGPALVANADAPPSESDAVAQILQGTNALRAANGLPPLSLASGISAVSDGWAAQLPSGFRHNPDFSAQMPAGWSMASENIASASYGNGHTMVEMWTNSDGHRRNMLNPNVNYIGIGWFVDSKGMRYAVQNFGAYSSPPGSARGVPAAPAPAPAPAPAKPAAPAPVPAKPAAPAPAPAAPAQAAPKPAASKPAAPTSTTPSAAPTATPSPAATPSPTTSASPRTAKAPSYALEKGKPKAEAAPIASEPVLTAPIGVTWLALLVVLIGAAVVLAVPRFRRGLWRLVRRR